MPDRLMAGELVGTVVDDRYTLEAIVGRGGMAVVYRAWDAELRRSVAIKILRDGAESDDDAHRRIREGRALAAINHPALVTLYDAVMRDERSYLVMELIDGVTLRQQINSGRLPSRDVALLAHDLADGLHAVHASGVVHRDIKPANILLAPTTVPDVRFRAKLSDFGVAHIVDATRVTSPGLFFGTAHYVSPEQAKGSPPSAAADIYSLGLTLLEALTGEAAYSGSAIAVITARLHRDPVIPSWLGAEWCDLLGRMTDRDPARRPTAMEVAAAARTLPSTTRYAPDDFGSGEVATAAQPMADSTLSSDPGGPSTDYGLQRTALLPTSDADADADATIETQPRTPRRLSTRTIAALVIGLLIAAAIAAYSVSALAPRDAEPTPQPSLPALSPGLDDAMHELLDEVSP